MTLEQPLAFVLPYDLLLLYKTDSNLSPTLQMSSTLFSGTHRRKSSVYRRVATTNDSGIDFGTSLDCPFEEYDDAEELDLEFKSQFLRCVRHLIDIRLFNDFDVTSATAIVRSESANHTGPHAVDAAIPLDTTTFANHERQMVSLVQHWPSCTNF
ncbi:hypothetical protein Agabi119p4_1374 [Agaricus bisporus var. burnettii]|uniref:Uncharacterized protein n=1 Tax=Agaricus bisporus var. burnettii TaxID=192524 RepID=A0A8H7FCK7_AGABI|nr:hypothetical protein Agabi119p4_1374 [Agaricus bisporus var. burnettii]